MRRAERVVDVCFAELGELLAEFGIVFLLALVEAEVLQHEHLTILKGRGLGLSVGADSVGSERNRAAEQLGEAQSGRAKRELLLEALARWTAEVAHEDDAGAFVAILGGSKVSDKIKVIDALMDKCDTLIIGGGMCFTFLLAQGKQVGTSLKEEDWVERAAAMLRKAEERGVKLLLPVDVVCADKFAEDANTKTVSVDEIPADMMGLDVGPETAKLYAQAISQAATVFWNGPMGVFEMEAFAAGTKAVAEAVAENQQGDTIIGGGDSVAAVNKFDLADRMTFISTGGGASMELVQGEALPGVEALKR